MSFTHSLIHGSTYESFHIILYIFVNNSYFIEAPMNVINSDVLLGGTNSETIIKSEMKEADQQAINKHG